MVQLPNSVPLWNMATMAIGDDRAVIAKYFMSRYRGTFILRYRRWYNYPQNIPLFLISVRPQRNPQKFFGHTRVLSLTVQDVIFCLRAYLSAHKCLVYVEFFALTPKK